jgi:SAM-dependent methyltransferase
MTDQIKKCVCGCEEFGDSMSIKKCRKCGAIVQNVDFTKEEMLSWYETEYNSKIQKKEGREMYSERYSHDLAVANVRLDKYKLSGRVLDVGCGNGAFVDACRARGLQAEGTVLEHNESEELKFYQGELSSIGFPTGSFDVVCYHDVLEHVQDPIAELKEARRILKIGGRLIVDFPRFYAPEGQHHWRPIQHLWMLTPDQLVKTIQDAGFTVSETTNPIPSKVVVDCISTREYGPKVLLIPGMGDIYWVAVKIHQWAKEKLPRVYIWNFDKRPRSDDYVPRIPFFDFAGYHEGSTKDLPDFDEGYFRDKTWWNDTLGFDHIVMYNGVLRQGKRMEDTDLHLTCDWNVPIFESLEDKKSKKEFKEKYGRYVVGYFSDFGMFKSWAKEWSNEVIADIVRRISKELNAKVLLTGCKWDKDVNNAVQALAPECTENICGQTSTAEILALMRGSVGVFGYCGGNTIQSAGFGIPTGMVWNHYFKDDGFFRTCIAPDAKYALCVQRDMTPTECVDKFLALYKDKNE